MNTKRYAALVTHMDYHIGRLLGALDNLGLRENTLIIFASDNGAAWHRSANSIVMQD